MKAVACDIEPPADTDTMKEKRRKQAEYARRCRAKKKAREQEEQRKAMEFYQKHKAKESQDAIVERVKRELTVEEPVEEYDASESEEEEKPPPKPKPKRRQRRKPRPKPVEPVEASDDDDAIEDIDLDKQIALLEKLRQLRDLEASLLED